MSAYIQYSTPMTHTKTLLEALCAMGFKTEQIEHQQQQRALVGYGGGIRPEQAHIIIRKRHLGPASNDLGFRKEEGGYRFIVSDFDKRRFNGTWLESLQQKYSELYRVQLQGMSGMSRRKEEQERRKLIAYQKQRIHLKAKKMGYKITESRVDGKTRLVLVKRS